MADGAPMTPKQIVELWAERFNAGDASGMAALYTENAVNHQVMQDPIIGRTALLAMFGADFSRAKMLCQIEEIHEAGSVAILEWSDPLGLRGCGFFTVVDNLIVFQRGYWDKLTFLKMHGLPIE
jgi:limonene-1,2-epoxide hydrolase